MRLLLLLLILGLFGCDHATKLAAKTALEGKAAVTLAPGVLSLEYVKNDDIAFNLFGRLGVPRSPAILAGMSLVAMALLAGGAIAARRGRSVRSESTASEAEGAAAEERRGATLAEHAGLALVVAGALGNLADRLARGFVVDFIHLRGWPVFNVADVAVLAGVGLLLVARLVRARREHDARRAVGPPPPSS